MQQMLITFIKEWGILIIFGPLIYRLFQHLYKKIMMGEEYTKMKGQRDELGIVDPTEGT